jgi:hypothetical protein
MARVAQVRGGADARADQNRRAAVGAGGQDDLPRTVGRARGVHDTGRPVAVEQDAVDLHVGRDREVGPRPHVVAEEGDTGVDAPSGDHVERIGSDAGLAGAVEVGDASEAEVRRGVDEGVERRGELVGPPGAHRQRTGPAAEVVPAVRGVLDGLERGQYVVEGPSVDAAACPLGEVGGACPDSDGRVHGGGASERLAAQGADRTSGQAGGAGVAPVMAAWAAGDIGVCQVRQVQVRPVGLAGLQQQHPAAAVLAEPAGEHGPGRAAADDHDVDFTGHFGNPAATCPISVANGMSREA